MLRQLLLPFLACGFALAQTVRPAPFDTTLLKGPTVNWGLSPECPTSIRLKEAWEAVANLPKQEVLVAVIDTGIDSNHDHLRGSLVTCPSEWNGEGGAFLPKPSTSSNFGIDLTTEPVGERPTDFNGHGTHIAGIIQSIYPKARILTIKYVSAAPEHPDKWGNYAGAIRWATWAGAKIINYSNSGLTPDFEEKEAIDEFISRGGIVICAAGNEGRQNLEKKPDEKERFCAWPMEYAAFDRHWDWKEKSLKHQRAWLSHFIPVISQTKEGGRLSSSNWSQSLAVLAAPGEKIVSSLPNNQWGAKSGTSQATAFVTGVVALIRGTFPDLPDAAIRRCLVESAITDPQLKPYCITGGRLNAEGALKVAARIQARLKAHPDEDQSYWYQNPALP